MGDKPELAMLGVHYTNGAIGFLYDLLKERDIGLSISHERMPSMEGHVDFVRSKPYRDWRIIWHNSGHMIGAVYLSTRNEIGVQILKEYQRRGYGEWAVRYMMGSHPGVRFLANINPRNEASIALFRKLGFTDWQVTLANPGKAHEPHLRGSRTGDDSTHHDVQDPQAPHG